MDGWPTEELAALPLAYWQEFCVLFARWCERGEFPTVWKHCRMVMLPETEIEPVSGAVPVCRMRPISVFPVHYRLLGSCFARRTRHWPQCIAPAVCHGALQGRSATDALAALQECFAKPHAVLVSLDMKQCFDRMNPRIALSHPAHAGMRPHWCSFLQWTWTDQRRWLQMGPLFSSEFQQVCHSVPQGCPMAPLALVCMLREAVASIGRNLRAQGPFHQTVFLDTALQLFTRQIWL